MSIMVKKSKILKNIEKSQKITFFQKKNMVEKNIYIYSLRFQILGGRDLTRALQSTTFQNPGGVV